MSFGRIIADARKAVGISQKALAEMIKKDDGTSISPQYLNDIEHDRRNPPAESLLEQFAEKLSLPLEYLHYHAGKLPDDVINENPTPPPDQVKAAFRAFRRTMQNNNWNSNEVDS